jgi:tetratricopeptide (TPR) repeat protein
VRLPPGNYAFGPSNATLTVTTGRRGAASTLGHDLILDVGAWSATLEIGERSSLVLTADGSSLHVREGVGGLRTLSAKDKADIRSAIAGDVLPGTAIEFRSTAMTRRGDELAVRGNLAIATRKHPIEFVVSRDGDSLSAFTTINQRNWGIKPYSALFGALRVDDHVGVRVNASLLPAADTRDPGATDGPGADVAAVAPPLISEVGRAELARIGQVMFGPPYSAASARIVTPDGSDYYLHAAEVLGFMPVPSSPEWTPFEDRLCEELVAAVEEAGGGWAWAGALVVASDMHLSSRNPSYLSVLDRAIAFVRGAGVPYELIPRFAFDRWAETCVAAGKPAGPDAWKGAEPASSPPAYEQPTAPAAPTADVEIARGDELARELDIDGALAAFERAEALGDVRGSLRVAALMEDHRADPASAEAAWRRADDAGHVNGAGNLGRVLKERGDMRGAEAAFRRAADRGSHRAGIEYAGMVSLRPDARPAEVADAALVLCRADDCNLWHDDGMLMGAAFVFSGLEDRCDPAAIEAGVRRADAEGSAVGAWHLGFLLRRRGQAGEALAAFRRAAERGEPEGWPRAAETLLALGDSTGAEAAARHGEQLVTSPPRGGIPAWRLKLAAAGASTILGMILDARGDLDGGLEAYRRADAGGDGTGSFNLGIELCNRGDLDGAEDALERAVERGADRSEAALADVRRRIKSL